MKDCIGCGFCCRKAKCALGVRLYPNHSGPCPELIWKEERWVCGAYYRSLGSLRERLHKELAIGAGCCCSLNDYRRTNHIPTPEELMIESGAARKLDVVFIEFIRSLSGQMLSGDVFALACYSLNKKLQQRGFNKNDIDLIIKEIKYNFFENRSKQISNFMG